VRVRFSALKKSGSIEACPSFSALLALQQLFSALKKSGSIEASWFVVAARSAETVFRFEKKRLH